VTYLDFSTQETQANGTTSQHTNDEEEWSEEQDEQEAGGVELEEVEEEGSDDEDAEEDKEEGEDDEDIPLSDLSGDERADVIPHQRLTINNSAAINSSIKRIAFITPNTPFSEHNSLVSTEPVEVPDPNDDLTRELAFYKVCQTAAVEARRQLKKEGVRFTRPGDYFAEMVKTDEHMTRIKQKLFDEAASKKAAADARRQRDLKKFGKQVQVAKLQQRQKEKRETLEKISSLKRSTFAIGMQKKKMKMIQMLTCKTKKKQNARPINLARPKTTVSSMSPSRRPANPTNDSGPLPVLVARPPNARRKTRSMASAARSDSPSPAMPFPRVTCVTSR
jgi:hypothetical protein